MSDKSASVVGMIASWFGTILSTINIDRAITWGAGGLTIVYTALQIFSWYRQYRRERVQAKQNQKETQ